MLKVQKSLSEGNSGGPALVFRDNRYEIAGIVLSRRGDLGEVGLIRSIGELQGLDWKPTSQRAVVSAVEMSYAPEAAGSAPVVQVNLRLFDLVRHPVRLLAYAFDGVTLTPYHTADPRVSTTLDGQLVLSAELPLRAFIERLSNQPIELPYLPPEIKVQDLAFRLAIWDVQEGRLLWSDSQWRKPQAQTAAVFGTESNAETPGALPSDTPASVETSIAIDTPQPAPTEPPTLVPTPTTTDTPPPPTNADRYADD